MIPIAPHITAFLQERLPIDRGASMHTCDSYSYAFQLLFEFASKRLKKAPSALQLEHIDARLVLDFLHYLESVRHNRASSRNVRLAAIKSFMRFIEYRVPAALEQVMRILAIPEKKTDTKLVSYLGTEEMQAVLDIPNPHKQTGIRDRAMLHLGFTTGLRVSELIGLRLNDVRLCVPPSVFVIGKGRRERSLPLCRDTVNAVRAWLSVRPTVLVPELFLNARGQALTRSGFECILRKNVKAASRKCLSLTTKRISPHVLRHSCAMAVLQATGDIRKVSLWLGHANVQTTEIYTRSDPTEKLAAIDRLTPPTLRRGRFRPPDKLIAFLKSKQ
jgi:site-specific recombinase XerD